MCLEWYRISYIACSGKGAGDESCFVETNQLSNNEHKSNHIAMKRNSVILDCSAAKKLTEIWQVNPSNLSSFMKLETIENIPKLKNKSQSVRRKKSSNTVQLDKALSSSLKDLAGKGISIN